MKQILLIGGLLLAGITSLSGQKYGHLNFGNLISMMPETNSADEQLETFQKELVAKGEEMAGAFQDKYGQFVADVQGGTLSPVQQQERQEALQQEQQKIVQYEQEVVQKVQNKREELLKPIFDRAEKAIAEVAEENGYIMIFDTSTFNAILFAEESDNVMDLVKAKLGIE